MTWRDDDIALRTKVHQFQPVHELFNKYGLIHTIAVITKDLEKNTELIDYIKSQDNIDVQVHCFEHTHLSLNKNLEKDLKTSIDTITGLFGKRPSVLYPPWNEDSPIIRQAASKVGLQVSTHKSSLFYYLHGYKSQIINFHYWAPEVEFLEAALLKHKNENSNPNS